MSEDAHRKLMQLYVLSGRRDRTLAQYVELETLLEEEPGVEPMEETQRLRQRVLKDDSATNVAEAQGTTLGPVTPLVSRRKEYDALRARMMASRSGKGQLTLISCESGVGKSRLARSFLDALGSTDDVTVLKGRCFRRFQRCSSPSPTLPRTPSTTRTDGSDRSPVSRESFSRHSPSSTRPTNLRRGKSATSADKIQSEIFGSLAELLRRLAGSVSEGTDFLLVLMLDDLEHADPGAIELLRLLETELVGYGSGSSPPTNSTKRRPAIRFETWRRPSEANARTSSSN